MYHHDGPRSSKRISARSRIAAPAATRSASASRFADPGQRASGDRRLTRSDIVRLQRSVGNRALAELMSQSLVPRLQGPAALQRTRWVWDGRDWIADGPKNTPKPTFAGGAIGAVLRDEPVGPDPYGAAETLADGSVIDYPALAQVMDHVELGVLVQSGVWRAMRQQLSNAITLKNKSHPAHGSNFDAPQRPEQQIKDWANVISGELKAKLQAFFVARYNLYL